MSRFSGQSLIESRDNWLKELDEKISLLEKAGIDHAEKEKIYRVMLSKHLLSLTKIRSGSVKTEVAKGEVRIAQARLNRDIAKILYDSCQQSIYQCKIEIKVVESDIINERVQR